MMDKDDPVIVGGATVKADEPKPPSNVRRLQRKAELKRLERDRAFWRGAPSREEINDLLKRIEQRFSELAQEIQQAFVRAALLEVALTAQRLRPWWCPRFLWRPSVLTGEDLVKAVDVLKVRAAAAEEERKKAEAVAPAQPPEPEGAA